MSIEIKANNKRIAKNTLFLYFRMLIVLLISLYTTRVLLRVLGVEDYGVYNVVSGFVSMFAFLNTSMANGIQRFYNFNLGKLGEDGLTITYNSALRIQLLLAVVVVVLVEGIGVWYINNVMVIPAERVMAANIIFQFSIASMLLIIFQAPYSGAIMAMEKMDYYAIVSIIDVLLKLGFVIVIQSIKYDKLITWGGVGLLIAIINFLLYFIYCKKKFVFLHRSKQYDKTEFKSMLGFSGWNMFGTFGNMMKNQGLNMILNLFFGPVVNAARGVAFQISTALEGFVSNNNVAVRPQLTQSYAQGNIKRTIQLMFSISKLNYLLLLVMAIPISVEIDFILQIWLGGNIPEHTASFAILVLAINLIHNWRSPVSLVVHATGVMKNYQLWMGVINLLTLPIAYLLLKLGWVPESAFVVCLTLDVFGLGVGIYILKTLVTFSIKRYLGEVIIPCLIVTLVTGVAAYVMRLALPSGWLGFVLEIILGFSISLVFSYFIGLAKEEKKMAKELLMKFINKVK